MFTAEQFTKWQRKRFLTYITFLFLNGLVGLQIGGTTSTTWLYLKYLIKTNNISLYFGLINAALPFPTLVFLPFIARWMDKSRNIKLCMIITNSLVIVGCFIYVIPLSPIYPLVGRFFMGFGQVMVPVALSEIARSYEPEELNSMLPVLNCLFNFGEMLGPVILLPFLKSNFWLGSIHINYFNIIGNELMVLVIMLQIPTIFCVFDISKEFDLKAFLLSSDNRRASKSEYNKVLPWYTVLYKAITNKDTLLIFMVTLMYGFFDQAVSFSVPIMITSYLKWSYQALNFVVSSYAIGTFLLVMVIAKIKIRTGHLYLSSIAGLVAVLVVLNCQLLLVVVEVRHNIFNIFLVIIFTAMVPVYLLTEKIFSSVMCAKLAKPCHQTYIESVRTMTMQTGRLFGGLFSAYYLQYFLYSYLVFSFLSMTFITMIFLRRRSLAHPTAII